MDELLAWLLEGSSWVRYRALVDLAREPESSQVPSRWVTLLVERVRQRMKD
jgi:hypothetical protein